MTPEDQRVSAYQRTQEPGGVFVCMRSEPLDLAHTLQRYTSLCIIIVRYPYREPYMTGQLFDDNQ